MTYLVLAILVDAGIQQQTHAVRFTVASGPNQRRVTVLRVFEKDAHNRDANGYTIDTGTNRNIQQTHQRHIRAHTQCGGRLIATYLVLGLLVDAGRQQQTRTVHIAETSRAHQRRGLFLHGPWV